MDVEWLDLEELEEKIRCSHPFNAADFGYALLLGGAALCLCRAGAHHRENSASRRERGAHKARILLQ